MQFFLLLILTMSWALAQTEPARPSGKYAVAVYTFEVVGGNDALGQNFANALETALSRSGRFTLIDRRALDKLLEETQLTLSGITANPQALKASNIDILVYGSINLTSSNSLRIDCKFLDTSTAQILSADSVSGRSATDFADLANRLTNQLTANFPLQGRVLEADSQAVQYYIDLGTASSLSVGQTRTFFRTQTIAGRSVPRAAGTFRVIEVLGQDIALVKVVGTLQAGYKPQKDDIVRLEATTARTPPPVLPGGLRINVGVAGATVLLNGENKGITDGSGQLELSN